MCVCMCVCVCVCKSVCTCAHLWQAARGAFCLRVDLPQGSLGNISLQRQQAGHILHLQARLHHFESHAHPIAEGREVLAVPAVGRYNHRDSWWEDDGLRRSDLTACSPDVAERIL